MRFRLYFRGGLPSNGRPLQKANLRALFSRQLAELWQQSPLRDIGKYIDPDYRPADAYLGIDRNGRTFYPIISEKLFTVAEVDLLLLRPGDPGRIKEGGGDIDNRLKTLLDSLSVPPVGETANEAYDDGPIYCLLEDDKLITRLNIETDRLLDPEILSRNEVVLVIAVKVSASSGRMSNIAIAL
jgi:hypothetical protein